MTDVHDRSAADLVAMIAAGEVSSLEVLDHFLARIERDGPAVNAVVTLDAERARARAVEADAAHARGESWGPLHGLPMTVKDAFETEGVVTTSGAPELQAHVPERDADAVARLRAAGAVVFGKTNLPIYAADVETFNEVHGRTNNPWALDRAVGGSSGGAAAALAAGQTGSSSAATSAGRSATRRTTAVSSGSSRRGGSCRSAATSPGRRGLSSSPTSASPARWGAAPPTSSSGSTCWRGRPATTPSPGASSCRRRNGGAVEGLRVATWFDAPAPPLAAACGPPSIGRRAPCPTPGPR